MNRWKCPDCKGWVAPEVTVHFCEKQGQVTPWPQRSDYRPSSSPYVYPVTPNDTTRPYPNDRPWVTC